ncbi:SH3 and PX-domain-containing 3 [Mycena venus]|uniref:SH3 and PX-domain-containing 3 n=1 Tax=Mycena venus TaxID=2733690 RepID=A0A8H6XM08_9AGAR|nr:SH3 and PX-domain-containing 3 [Mycena venus]
MPMPMLSLCKPQHVPPRLIAPILLSLILLSGFVYYQTLNRPTSLHLVPYTPPVHTVALGHPTFEDVREYERALPQHRPQSRPRYVFFPREAWGTGWNNVFQEQLLNTHLAYLANRGYVFVDYIARDHPPFPDTLPNGTRHMLHIPMNALTSGPTGGGSWGDGVDAAVHPRPISQRWWDVACPAEKVVEVHMAETMRELNITDESTGEERLVRWAEKLRGMEEECVSVIGGTPFDYMFIGSDKVVSIWSSYGSSPTLTQYAWSALITRALSRNFALFSPGPSPPPSLSPTLSRITTTPGAGSKSAPYPLTAFFPLRASEPPIPGLLALHLRRGDYADHCKNLAGWGSDYNTWNKMGNPEFRATGRYPSLPDHLTVRENETRYDAAYAHCWPSPDAIVERVRAVREGRNLRTVYMATNGEPEWVGAIAARLRADGWDQVASSLDMELAPDEFAVSQAVDMGVLVAAEVFIGNGFSSVSSNVVQLRLAGGRGPDTSRFW